MESILIWFATGFSFVSGMALGMFFFSRRPTKLDQEMKVLCQVRNEIEARQAMALENIAELIGQKVF